MARTRTTPVVNVVALAGAAVVIVTGSLWPVFATLFALFAVGAARGAADRAESFPTGGARVARDCRHRRPG